jgi:hypothetical protein
VVVAAGAVLAIVLTGGDGDETAVQDVRWTHAPVDGDCPRDGRAKPCHPDVDVGPLDELGQVRELPGLYVLAAKRPDQHRLVQDHLEPQRMLGVEMFLAGLTTLAKV